MHDLAVSFYLCVGVGVLDFFCLLPSRLRSSAAYVSLLL